MYSNDGHDDDTATAPPWSFVPRRSTSKLGNIIFAWKMFNDKEHEWNFECVGNSDAAIDNNVMTT